MDKDNINKPEHEKNVTSCKNRRVVFHINDTESFGVYNLPEKSLVFDGPRHRIGACEVEGDAPDIDRMLLCFELPQMPKQAKLQNARIILYQHSGDISGSSPAFIGVQRIKDNICVGKSAPAAESSIIDFCKAKEGAHTKLHSVKYELDITKAVVTDIRNSSNRCSLQIRMLDETGAPKNHVYIHGSESANFRPQIIISYINDCESVAIEKNISKVMTAEKLNNLLEEEAPTQLKCTNLLKNHSFYTLHHWKEERANAPEFSNCCHLISRDILFGTRCYKMYACNEFAKENGVYQDTIRLSKGDYNFSVYMRIRREIIGEEGSGAYIRVTDNSGTILAESCRLTKIDSVYTRLGVKFSLKKAAEVRVHILIDGRGGIFVDAAQLEKSEVPTSYNMVENGGFEYGMSNWVASDDKIYDTGITAYEGYRALRITGNREKQRMAFQIIQMHPGTEVNESYVFSAVAKGVGANPSVAKIKNPPRFEMKVEVTYISSATGERSVREHAAQFFPKVEEWQYVSVNIEKKAGERLLSLKLICDFSYNTGVAYFDSICLKKRLNQYDLNSKITDLEKTKQKNRR